jgi:hypothetical protein
VELFAIVGAIPAAFAAAAVYSSLLRFLSVPPKLKKALVWLSGVVLAGLLVEWTLLALIGVLALRAALGPVFEILHLALFLSAIPALVHVLVFTRPDSAISGWLAVAALSAALALPVVLIQYGVSEALYGVDGSGGPYGRP